METPCNTTITQTKATINTITANITTNNNYIKF